MYRIHFVHQVTTIHLQTNFKKPLMQFIVYVYLIHESGTFIAT
jgi:hypothetical protein